MTIPKKFKVAGFDVTVELVDKTDDNNFGNWNDVTNTITIAKNISLKNGELTVLSERQMLNTFYIHYLNLYQNFQKYSFPSFHLFYHFFKFLFCNYFYT